MAVQISSYALRGLQAHPVQIEVDVCKGMPYFTIIGMASTSVQEAKERVRGAIQNSGFRFPLIRKTVNLAPADLPKRGSHYDLPMALGLLVASGQISSLPEKTLFFGELGLEGGLRPVTGAMLGVLFAKEHGFKEVVLPEANLQEASVVEGIQLLPVRSLKELLLHLKGSALIPKETFKNASLPPKPSFDLTEVSGHCMPKRALVLAAAGGHHVLMSGPPGSGKSLLALGFSSLFPALTKEEALEVWRIHSASNETLPTLYRRPFRSLHGQATAHQLLGGGPQMVPGEVSLAHKGVLFIDELPELSRHCIEALRLPLESKEISLRHGGCVEHYPCEFQLIAAMNPCPCGYYGDPQKTCLCAPHRIKKYQSKLSGPILDRIDIHVDVPRLSYEEMAELNPEALPKLLEKIRIARDRQTTRQGCLNQHLGPGALRRLKVSSAGSKILRDFSNRFALSGRGIHRTLRLAQTLADLDQKDEIQEAHFLEAIQFRIPTQGGLLD